MDCGENPDFLELCTIVTPHQHKSFLTFEKDEGTLQVVVVIVLQAIGKNDKDCEAQPQCVVMKKGSYNAFGKYFTYSKCCCVTTLFQN